MQRRHWTTVVPVVVIVLALAAVLAGCGGDSGTTTTAAPTTETTGEGSAIDAAALFSSNCASCHGADGAGNVGPDLRGAADSATVAQQIAQGGGSMPAFADKLSTDEIDALAEYVVGLE
jgi:cytochrome c551